MSIPPGEHQFYPGSSVTLEAKPEPGYRFSHWSGDSVEGDSTSPEVILTVVSPDTVIAHFVPDV